MPVSASAARVRGVTTGLLTAALSVAAHGAGGGVLPNGAAMSLLAVLAATAGALAAAIPHAGSPLRLLSLLAVSQLLGHLLLSAAAGHHHEGSSAPPAAAMLAAHLLAIVAGATLIGVGERLWRTLSRAVRAVVRIGCAVAARPMAVARRADQPLRSALLLAASVSHRGPPVSLAR
jgi:hypothetical protein